MSEQSKAQSEAEDRLVEEMKTWTPDKPYDFADWGDAIVLHEGQTPEEIKELYPEVDITQLPPSLQS